MIVAALTSTVAGRLADRFGRKTVLIAGLSFLALGFGVAGTISNRFLFFLSLGITGLGYGFTPPSLYAVMSDLLPKRRGLGASLVSVSYGIGGAIGALLASRVTAALGWRAAFLAVAVIALADMLLQFYWIRNIRSIKSAVRAGSIKDSLSLPLLILAVAEFIGGSVFWSSAAWTPTLLRSAKMLTLQETGWIMGVLSMANMLGSFCLGSLSDKLGRRRVIVLSSFPAALAAFAVFYWLQTPLDIALGIFVFGLLKASAGSRGSFGAGGLTSRERRYFQRHHHGAALHCGSRGATGSSPVDFQHRRSRLCDDSLYFGSSDALRQPDRGAAGAQR